MEEYQYALKQAISIHAPREGGDQRDRQQARRRHDFNPRPPRGGRRTAPTGRASQQTFQSTPPARGATVPLLMYAKTRPISIHAPREGGDETEAPTRQVTQISIHAPREGGDASRTAVV